MNLFGKKKDDKPKLNTEQSQAVTVQAMQGIQAQIEILDKKEILLTQRIDKCARDAVTKMQKKDKQGALFEMKRKKSLEMELNKVFNMKLHLEQQGDLLQSTLTNISVIKVQSEVNNAMKIMSKGLDREAVDDIMEENRDLMEAQNEIGEAFAQPLVDTGDEADLLAELESMMGDSTAAAPDHRAGGAVSGGSAFNFPSVPQRSAAQDNRDEEELRALEAAMGM